jgi:hypothetical protein
MKPAVLGLLLFALSGAAGQAATCDGVDDLLAFVSDQTGYSAPLDCPVVERSADLQGNAALRSQVGAYVPATGHILLDPGLDTDRPLGRSYLLHELVHAAQFQAGMQLRVKCEGELERESYSVQTAYLRRHGEFREAMLIDWIAETLGRCSGDAPAMGY